MEANQINQIFNAFYTYCKNKKLKVTFGGEDSMNKCPFFSLKERKIHLMTKEENIHNLREMIHEWTHSTFIITNRCCFNDYPLEELVAEKTAYEVMEHFEFYDVDSRENYTWKFKHASYIAFWVRQALKSHKGKTLDEIIELTQPHIDVAKNLIIKLVEEER